MTKLLPTIDTSFPWIEIRREMQSQDDLEITLPTGDSYNLTLAETRLYMKQLRVPNLRAEKALDKVWNFYAVRLHLSEDKDYLPESIEPPRYPEVMGPRPLDPYAWVIERNV